MPTDWSSCVFTSEHHSDWVSSVAFSPDEKYFVSGSWDGTICICDSETGNLISGPFRGPDHVRSSFFDFDGGRVWASFYHGQIVGWDVDSGNECAQFPAGEKFEDIIGCCWFRQYHGIVSVSKYKGTVALWKGFNGKQMSILLKIPTGGHRVSFSPNGFNMAWVGEDDTRIRIWELTDGAGTLIPSPSHSQPQLGHTQPISTLSFSVDGDFVVSGSEGGTILVWDVKTGDVVDRLVTTNKARISAVAYSHENCWNTNP
jgi:WD40 repeat protein